MFGNFLGSCKNFSFLSQSGKATFGKTFVTFYFNIWSPASDAYTYLEYCS